MECGEQSVLPSSQTPAHWCPPEDGLPRVYLSAAKTFIRTMKLADVLSSVTVKKMITSRSTSLGRGSLRSVTLPAGQRGQRATVRQQTAYRNGSPANPRGDLGPPAELALPSRVCPRAAHPRPELDAPHTPQRPGFHSTRAGPTWVGDDDGAHQPRVRVGRLVQMAVVHPQQGGRVTGPGTRAGGYLKARRVRGGQEVMGRTEISALPGL